MDQPFRSYASPPPHLAFSADFFQSLTIAQAAEHSYPSIAPIGSVLSTSFSQNIPLSAAATVIRPGEVIPNYNDLNTITSNIEDEYRKGFRSAEVKFRHKGLEYSVVYHFSKLELIRQCTNYEPAVNAYRHLLAHLHSEHFNLGPALTTFQDSLVTARIQGFCVSHFRLDKLGCLLGESWLEEDVFNVLLELAYFRKAYHTDDAVQVSDILLLPTS
ncbi:hypothetical protein BDZ97DRAFT_1644347, partial [Flammula alnicola]